MSIPSLIRNAEAVGVRIYLRDGRVKLRGPEVAMEAVRASLAPRKAEIIAYLQSAEQQAGEFWPWAPYLNADDVRRFRTELVGAIETLAEMERWPDEHRDDVLTRAIRGPLADLLPNLHHFSFRLSEAKAEAAARAKAQARTWRFDR
ncbi:TubC N-terminal docking domain-related protein [Paraburkholderia terrae]